MNMNWRKEAHSHRLWSTYICTDSLAQILEIVKAFLPAVVGNGGQLRRCHRSITDQPPLPAYGQARIAAHCG